MTDDNRWLRTRTTSGDDCDATYERRAAAGENVHGEADFLRDLPPGASILDAGCGTGRIGRELARRGFRVVGVDLDDNMLDTPRRKAPEIEWRTADLETVDLGRTFDAVLMAGNVMIFLTPGTEAPVIAKMARHLASDGVLVAGFQLQSGRLDLAAYDAHCAAAGLALTIRYATWERAPFVAGGDYAVSVHRRV